MIPLEAHNPHPRTRARKDSDWHNFISALRGLQPTTHLLNQLRSLKHYRSSPYISLTHLSPKNRGLSLPPIGHIEGRYVNISVIVIIIKDISQRNVGNTTPTKIQHACSKHILKILNGLLTMVISLRVISSTKMQSSTHLLVVLPPEPGSKTVIPVTNH